VTTRDRKYSHRKYTYTPGYSGFGAHMWQLVGAKGGVHFTATFYKAGEYPTCGLEMHFREPPDDSAPSQTNCWLIGGPCWHEGTSLYASETLWPQIKPYLREQNHNAIFDILAYEAECRFKPKETDDDHP